VTERQGTDTKCYYFV